jgi:hypothetical protein
VTEVVLYRRACGWRAAAEAPELPLRPECSLWLFIYRPGIGMDMRGPYSQAGVQDSDTGTRDGQTARTAVE